MYALAAWESEGSSTALAVAMALGAGVGAVVGWFGSAWEIVYEA